LAVKLAEASAAQIAAGGNPAPAILRGRRLAALVQAAGTEQRQMLIDSILLADKFGFSLSRVCPHPGHA
jgi:hypothetical protein